MRNRLMRTIGVITAVCGVIGIVVMACSDNRERSKYTHVARGDRFTSTGDLDAAVIEYRSALQDDPRFADGYRKLSNAYIARGQFADALRTALAGADAAKSRDNHVAAGNLLLLAGRFDEAKARAEAVLTGDGRNVLARALLANATRTGKNGDAAAAGPLIGRAASADPILSELGVALGQHPNDVALLSVAAAAHASLGDFAAAERLLRRATAIRRNLLSAYWMLARIYVAEHRLDTAREEMQELSRTEPDPVAALTVLGTIDQLDDRVAEARAAYERALQIDPNAAIAANNLAWLYAEDNASLDRALQLAQTAAGILPDRTEVNDTLGWVCFKKGLLPLARTALERSVDLDTTNATAWYHLARVYEAARDTKAARRAMERYLALDPSSPRSTEVKKRLRDLSA